MYLQNAQKLLCHGSKKSEKQSFESSLDGITGHPCHKHQVVLALVYSLALPDIFQTNIIWKTY